MSCLNELVQFTTRSSAASSLVNIYRQIRGVCSSSLQKNPDSCLAIFQFIEWWLMMSHLNEVVQVAARSSAASNFGDVFSTDERSSSLNTKIPTAVKHFWILLTADHVVTECDYTSCSQVFSCKQFDDFFLNRWEVCSSFILPQKVPTAVKHILFYFIDDCWCLIWMSFYK